jgi:ATP phosphoribosyltransferase regulatory subunit
MRELKIRVPEGAQDYLPVECRNKRLLQRKIERLFAAWGYQPVETPTMEYLELFHDGVGAFEQERLFKLIDGQGRLLALRPDITVALARIAATRMRQEAWLRLSYQGSVFNFAGEDAAGGLREYTQTGIELMGETGVDGDAEVIALAVRVMEAAGLTGFQLDVGQVEFFRGLMEEAGFGAEETERVRELVEQKNSLALELRLQQAGVAGRLRNNIMELPALYGDPDVLRMARSYSSNRRCRAALDNIERMLDILAGYGLERFVSIDLGMVQSVHYYTGIIFRGMAESLGYPILTGGRYDRLVSEFGRDMPATGFAVSVKALLLALERQGTLEKGPAPVDLLVGFDPACRTQAIRIMEDARAQGLTAEQYFGGRETLARDAQNRSATRALWVDGEGAVCVIEGGERP